MADTARRVLFSTLIVVSVVVAVLALWELRLLIALLFFAFIVAAAMRPGIEALRSRGIPRGVGIAAHYVAIAGLLGLLLWLAVPRATDQVQEAVGGDSLRDEARRETGWRHDALVELDRWLRDLPSTTNVFDRALDATRLGFEILIGVFFVFASAAYWIFERNRAMALVLLLVPEEKRRVVRDTWNLIDLKLGAYVRGQLILIVAVATVLSLVVLGHRPAVLAPRRHLRGRRRDRARDRAADRWRARCGGRPYGVLGARACRRPDRAPSAADRGLPRDPEGARRRRRALAAARPRLGDGDGAPVRSGGGAAGDPAGSRAGHPGQRGRARQGSGEGGRPRSPLPGSGR